MHYYDKRSKNILNALIYDNQIFLPLDETAELTGLKYYLSESALLFDTGAAVPFTYKRTNPPSYAETLVSEPLLQLALDPYATDGRPLDDELIKKNEELISLQFDRPVINPILYNDVVYISGEYLHDIIKYHESEIIANDQIAKAYAPIVLELLRAYDIISANSNELDCDYDSIITVTHNSKSVSYVRVRDEWLEWLGVTSVQDLTMYTEIYFAPEPVKEKILGSDSSAARFIGRDEQLRKQYYADSSCDSYRPIYYLETVSVGKTSVTLKLSAQVNGKTLSGVL